MVYEKLFKDSSLLMIEAEDEYVASLNMLKRFSVFLSLYCPNFESFSRSQVTLSILS